MSAINVRELRRMVEDRKYGPVRAANNLISLLESKEVRPSDFSFRDLARGFMGDEWFDMARNVKGGFSTIYSVEVKEATAVNMAAFSNISGQIVYNKVREGFELPDFIGEKLVTKMNTENLLGEKIAGVGGLGDAAERVSEGRPYPMVGLNEEYVETPVLEKHGLIVPITREAIIMDRTGQLLMQAGKVGEALGLRKEKRILKVVLGITNNYKRNGTSTDTYLTSGAYINDKTSNALVNWTDIEALELLFHAIKDPNTDEPIAVNPDALIVPTELLWTAEAILASTGYRYGDGANNTVAQYSPNPLNGGINRRNLTVYSNRYVYETTTDTGKWFYGEPKKAFLYVEAWPITTTQAPAGAEDEFKMDIVAQYKASEYGVAAVYEPRYMCRSDA